MQALINAGAPVNYYIEIGYYHDEYGNFCEGEASERLGCLTPLDFSYHSQDINNLLIAAGGFRTDPKYLLKQANELSATVESLRQRIAELEQTQNSLSKESEAKENLKTV